MRKSWLILLINILVLAGVLISAPPAPSANMLVPSPSGWAGCSLQVIKIKIQDSDGVDESTISLEVDGTIYNWPDVHLTWDGDSILTFTPTFSFPNDYFVDVNLLYVEDSDGTPISGPVSWTFHTDLDKPYFYPSSRTPPPDTVIDENEPTISVDVVDSTSGIPIGGLCMCIESASYNCPDDRLSGYCWETDPDITYIDSTFYVITSGISVVFQPEDSVTVCLRKAVDFVPQSAQLCGPNWIDTLDSELCWDFLVDSKGPSAILVYPNEGDTIGCDTLVVALIDFSEIDTTTCQFRLDDDSQWVPYSPYLNVYNDTVYYTGTGTAEYYSEGLITCYVNRVSDVNGNRSTYFGGDFPAWNFTVDKSPPEASSPDPMDGGVSDAASPNISVQLTDPIAGVLADSIVFNVDGTDYPLSTTPGVTWDGTRASFNTGSAGLSWGDGDTVDVCVTAIDKVRPDRCGPNRMNPPYCWSFIIDNSGPTADIIDPPDGGWTGCDYQEITIWLYDVAGIETSTIEVTVDGTSYTFPDHLTFSDDTLVFTPTVPFADGATIDVSVDSAEDDFGHGLVSPVASTFFVDLSPPFATSIAPTPGEIIGPTDLVEIGLDEAGIGVDGTSFEITMRGTPYSWPAYMTWDGSVLTFDPFATGESFSDGDTIQFCLNAADLIEPIYCGPNELDTCWYNVYDQSGPIAEFVYPGDSVITSCASDEIRIYLQDASGIDYSTTNLSVNGTPYTWPSARLSYDGDTLVFTPASPFTHADTIEVVLNAADDSVGNSLVEAPRSWMFIIDNQPPEMIGYNPSAGGVVSDPTPTVRIGIADQPAGVDTAAFSIEVEGTPYSWPHTAMSWDGSDLTFDCAAAGLSFSDGDSVHVCMRDASDNVSPAFCGPNAVDFDSCWAFAINLSGPVADLIYPLDHAFSACPLQTVIFSITDDQGVIPESCTVEIDGVEYDYPDHLIWSNDSLTFTPTTSFTDGDTIHVAVLDASDSLGNALSGTFEWWFVSDQSPPVLLDIDPPPGTIVNEVSPVIDIITYDSLSGENPVTFAIHLDGTPYVGMLPWIWWLDPGFSLQTGSGGLSWSDGDTIEVCLDSIADIVSEDYCGPNVARPDSCWEYYVDLSAPEVALIYPDSGIITACADSQITIWLHDNLGINEDSIRFWINGSSFDLSSPRLTYINDTLRYAPLTAWTHGDTFEFQVSRAIDIAGNELTDAPTWQFIVDIEPPELVSINPLPGTILSDPTPTLEFGFEDFPAGVDSSAIQVNLDGTFYTLADAGVTWNSGTGVLAFDASAAGASFGPDTMDVCINASDNVPPTWCGPNIFPDSCYAYPYDLIGPNASPIDPMPGEITACDMVDIKILLTDDRSVEYDSIRLSVDGTEYSILDPELSYIGDSLLIFSPPAPYPEGTIDVILEAYDISGNALDGGPLNYSFEVDLSPPILSGQTPAPGAVISTLTPAIEFDLTDTPAGVEESSILLEVAGEVIRTTDTGVSWDGTHFSLNTATYGLTFEDGDSVVCCVSASDAPDSCGPNSMDPECWTFHINISGPLAGIISPQDNWITSCDDQSISLWITDGNGVDESTIMLTVNGVPYTTAAPELTYDGDSILTFTPSIFWSHYDTVNVQLSDAEDVYGSPLSTSLTWQFIVDLEPPVVESFEPPSGTDFNVDDTLIYIVITDAPAGINRSSLMMRIGSVDYSWPHPGMTWPDDTLSFWLSDLGYTPTDGETLEICVQMVGDAPDLCPPNELMTSECATYTFDFRGPTASLLNPPESSWVSCHSQPIEIYLSDANGVDLTTLELTVDGMLYTWPDPTLDYTSPTLTFTPLSPWPEGVEIAVSLERADDMAGNPLEDGPLEFVFGIDTTAPGVLSTVPGDGSVVDPSITTISAELSDNASGIYADLMTMIVNGTPYNMGHTSTSWDGSVFSLNVATAGISFEEGDSVEVCVDSVSDNAVLCGPNIMPQYCWAFVVDGGPPSMDMIWPPEGSIVSCPEESIVVAFHDPGGIEFDSLQISIGGVLYGPTDTEISIRDDSTMVFTPVVPFSHASNVIVQVLNISDNYGNTSGSGPVWSFQMDIEPPEADMFYPTPMTIGGLDSISLSLIDIPAGVDPSSISLTVTGFGSFDLTSPALFWDDPILAFDPGLTGLTYEDGDTAQICVAAADAPDICPPNVMSDTCWSFIVDAGGPVASLVLPDPGTVTSCDDHGAIFEITDPSGIEESSISIRINGSIVDITDPSISWTTPTLRFEPSTPWGHGDTVEVSINAAEDMTGNAMAPSDTAGTYYLIDTEPPLIGGPFPPNGSIVADPIQPIWVSVTDFPAGVDTMAARLTVDGTAYSIMHPALYWDFDELHFDPATAGVVFENGDTIEVCALDIADLPDTCSANELTSPWCWEFYVNLAGPVARIGEPRPNRWVACESGDQQVSLIITDPDGIVEDSIRLEVEGSEYTIGDPELSYIDTILTFIPSTAWTDGDTIDVTLAYAEDSLGNGLGAPIEWSFFIDLQAPYTGPPIPSAGSISGALPDISVPVFDDGSGVDPSSVTLSFDGSYYSIGSGLAWSEPIATIFSDSLVSAPSGTVTVCVDSAADSPDYCEPNELEPPFCWDFVIDISNPEAHFIAPGDGDWVACDSGDQLIEIYLHDDNGIIADSITMRVAGAMYSYSGGPMVYSDTILTFIPPTPWVDGDTVVVQLLRAPDSLGNPLSPLVYEFYIDLQGPQVESPSPIGTSSSLTPLISAEIRDFGAGLDTSTIKANIDGFDYPIGITPGFTWVRDDTTAYLDCATAGISFSMGDTVDICFSAEDSPDWCDPNYGDTCWSFIADEGGPLVALVSPDSNACSACSLQGFTARISDVTGVDISSIYFRVNDVPYTVDSAGVVYDAMFGRLDFEPSEPWEDGDIIHVDSLIAMDLDGNWADEYLEFFIYIDLSPPIVFGFDPPIEGFASSASPEISFVLVDSGCGLNAGSVRFTVEGNTYTLDSAGVDYSGDTVTFDSGTHGMIFEDGDTVNVCVTDAADMAMLCSPNTLPDTICWRFYVSSEGPAASAISPTPGQWVACDSGEQSVSLLLEDTDGIDESTIEFILDSVSYNVDSAGLSFDPLTGELNFVPSEAWSDGETLEVVLYSAEDSLGHDLATPLTYLFYTDQLPPDTTFVEPELGIAIHPAPIWAMAGIVDVGAGLVDTTLGISVNGTWHDYGDPGVTWTPETLIYDGLVTGDTLFAAETLEICVRGADEIDVCEPNWMEVCWEYVASANGPVATPEFPLSGTVISCLDSLVVFNVADTDGDQIDYTSFLVEVNGTVSGGWPTIHHYDDAESLLYINPGTAPPAPDTVFDHGDTISVTLLECEDIYHSPLASPLTIWFVLDSIGPVIIDAYPPSGGSITPGAPDMWFLAEDMPAGLNHTEGEIQIGPYNYSVPGDISFSGDTLKLPSGVYSSDTTFFDGDTICLNITLYDSAQYCGENVSETEWCFTVGVTPPVLVNLLPPDGAISSCTGGGMAVLLDDADGFDYDNTGINVNGTDYVAAFDIEITVHGDTMFFDSPDTFEHGENITWYPFAQDIHGTPAESVDTFSLTIDIEPPVAEDYLPLIDAEIYDWQAPISLQLSDSLAGLSDSVALTLTTSRWSRVFAPGSTAFTWVDGALDFDVPAYNGGTPWEPSMDDELIFWHERETVLVEIYSSDMACCCGPNDSVYAWNFIIIDDDTTGPTIMNIQPTEVYSGFAADVRANVTDPAGIYDDATSIQGMYVIWDSDGSLADGGESLSQMSLESGDSYLSDTPIGPFTMGDVPIFCIVAHDDDYDFEDSLDRAVSVSDTIFPTLIEGSGPQAELIFPSDSSWISCDSGPVIIQLDDAQGVDESSVQAVVFEDTLLIDDGLQFIADTLYWWPESLLANGLSFDFELISADDELGYSLDSIYSWNFRIDTEAPTIILRDPESVANLTQPVVSWEIEDNAAGVAESLLIIRAEGYELRIGDPGIVWDGATLTFDAGLAGFDLTWEDLLVCLEACDAALSCGANCTDTTCIVMSMAKDTPCDVWPIPFTPNADGANDVVWFEYPNMFYEGASIEIFDLEGRRVYSNTIPPTRPESEAFWDGLRNSGRKAIPGTYIYVITRGDEILCKGSLVLVR